MKDWEIKCGNYIGHHEKGIIVFLYNRNIDYYIRVSIKDLQVFGFVSNGCELGITGQLRYDNLEEQEAVKERIVSEEIKLLNNEVDYHTIKYYLLYKYKSKRKVEKDAITRVLNILNEDFQSLCKLKIENIQEELSKIKIY